MQKTLEDYFRDWEGEAFGYGYGTGEFHIVPVLHKFMSLCEPKEYGKYDYEVLEKELGAATAWLLINVFCRHDIIEYGISSRVGWLTKEGNRLREFVCSKTPDELYEIVMNDADEVCLCYRNACNCGENGYQEGVLCKNPFWKDRVK